MARRPHQRSPRRGRIEDDRPRTRSRGPSPGASMIPTDRPIASARDPRSGLRHRLTRASRRLWLFSFLAALAAGVAVWVGIESGPDWLYGRAQAEARAGRYGRAAVYLDWL